MEESLKFLNLSIPLGEGSHLSPSISYRRGNISPLKASLKPQQGPTSGEGEEDEEEGRTDTQKLDHIDSFDLSDWRENIKPPGDLAEIIHPDQLLPLCVECQAFPRMGNQQGMKIKPPFQGYAECQAASPKSPRFQIPRKRRRRGEKPIYFTESVPRSKLTTLPSNERTLSKLQKTSTSTFGGWNLEDDRHIFCTPASRRKIVLKSQHKFEPLLELRSLGALTADSPVSQNSLFPQNGLFAKKEPSLQDSDTDQSEYDELPSVLIYPCSNKPARKTEEGAWDEPKCPLIKPEKYEDEEKERKLEGKISTWVVSEMAKKAAAERVRSKIEELEGIIRQVSLNSSSHRRQKESKCLFNVPVHEEKSLQNAFHQDTGTQLMVEFQALSEALSQSLLQVLMVEGAREEKLLATSSESSRLNPVLCSEHCTSNWSSNTTSNSYSSRGETTHFPPPSPSPMLEVSEETSASFEGTSPILSPLFSSSHKSLKASWTCQQGVSDHHRFRSNFVEGDLSPQWKAATKDSGSTEKENRNCFCQGNLRPSEWDQAQVCRCINERDLLSSGNFDDHGLHQEH